MILGRLWQYDRRTMHDGFANTYAFSYEGKHITLLPTKDRSDPVSSSDDIVATPPSPSPPISAKPVLFLSKSQFLEEAHSADIVFVRDTPTAYIQLLEIIWKLSKLLFSDSSVFHVRCSTSVFLLPSCNGLSVSIFTWALMKEVVAFPDMWQEKLYVLATVDLFENLVRYTCSKWELNSDDVASYDCLFLEIFDLKLQEAWRYHYSFPFAPHHMSQLECFVVAVVIWWKEFSFKSQIWCLISLMHDNIANSRSNSFSPRAT